MAALNRKSIKKFYPHSGEKKDEVSVCRLFDSKDKNLEFRDTL